MITQKENYLMLLRGEQPEFVPSYGFGMMGDEPVANVMIEVSATSAFRETGGGKDPWGVNFVGNAETGGALIPEPNNYILDDITKWRDVIKAPSLEGIDWEKQVNDALKRSRVDRSQSAVAFNMHYGFFQNLMGFMGFEEGLCAMFEEPEEVKALFEYLCDWYCEIAEHVMPILKPDVFTLMDDTAAWANPFISPERYHELVMPYHKRQAAFGRDNGLPITMHNCGKCECFLDDFFEIGVTAWDPAQTCNDLAAIKAKYGNKLVLMGAWDGRGRLLEPDVTEEELRQSVRDAMDKYAVGGGFAWFGSFLGSVDDQHVAWKNAILEDEVLHYGRDFYRTH